MTDRMMMVCPVCHCWYGTCNGRRGCPVQRPGISQIARRIIWTAAMIAVVGAGYLSHVWKLSL